MTPADKPAFVAALTELALVKNNAKLTAEQFTAWWNALRDWPLEQFTAACRVLVVTREYMPNPFHFEELRRQACAVNAGDAWARARAHARSLPAKGGFLQDTTSGDEFLDRVARACGGYKAIANASERDLQFMGQRFAEHYDSMTDADQVRAALPALTNYRKRLA